MRHSILHDPVSPNPAWPVYWRTLAWRMGRHGHGLRLNSAWHCELTVPGTDNGGRLARGSLRDDPQGKITRHNLTGLAFAF